MLKQAYYRFRNMTSWPGEKGGASAGFWQHKVREAVFSQCGSSMGSLLEVGCGEGLFLQKFRQEGKGLKLFGIDFFFGQLQKAKARIGLNTYLFGADATALPFKDASFDNSVCINVFLNMPKAELVDMALDEILRVLKKGGRIFFDIRNKLNPFIYAKYKLVKYYDATIDADHLRLFKPHVFEEKLKKIGFEVIGQKSIGFPRGKFAPIIIMEAVKR